ncbi:hypothetical protein B0H16DRAFT_110737 [Mycena metata]|uniref:F-box domain-containing protein n=1 Tax=Mycena metata TaxID=1033252 RepID=A0AAD7I7K8_9AGAR|nr:hypothetical protein B0H16DRAFT_110737 [Mycena metata]
MSDGAHIAVLRLPYDITSEIFTQCLPAHRRVRPDPSRAPLLLAQICSGWRTVALTTPKLWASIYLEFPVGDPCDGIPVLLGIPDRPKDHTCELLELWLSRATGHPISLTIICGAAAMPSDVLDAIAANSTRCGRLELALTMRDLLRFNEMALGPFPRLRSLGIRVTDKSDIPPLNILSNSLSPKLLALRLLGFDKYTSTSPNLDSEEFPTSLTSLEAAIGFHAEDFGRLISRLPNLTHLAIFRAYREPRSSELHIPVLGLRTLLLRSGPLDFLDLLTIPSLEHLEICLYREPSPVLSFLARSACHLTRLTLDLVYADEETYLVPCLMAAPHLITLELVFSRGRSSPELWAALKPIDLPDLRILIIAVSAETAPYAPFLALLHARPSLVHAELNLHALRNKVLAPPADDLRAEFEALVRRGITVRVKTPELSWPDPDQNPDAPGNLGTLLSLVNSNVQTNP